MLMFTVVPVVIPIVAAILVCVLSSSDSEQHSREVNEDEEAHWAD